MKKLVYIILIMTCFMFKTTVYAGSYTVTASSSALVGNKVYIYVNVSNLVGKFKIESSNSNILSGGSSGIWLENESKTFTFSANRAGTATITVTPLDVADLSNNTKYTTAKSLTISVSSPSSNNYLSSLKVGDYALTPQFNKDVLEYNVEVPNDVRKVNISTTKDNATATVRGAGEVNLAEGLNDFSISVTAQNGNVRTYKLYITVKELDPIEVELDGIKYTIIRKQELMPSINEYFKADTVLIGEEEVPCYINEVLDMTLVGLQNGENANLFIYDGTYKPYNELSLDRQYIQILDMDMSLLGEGYALSKIDINNKSFTAYIKEGYSYPVIYGLNVKTGDKALYKYDSVENTLQRMEKINIKNNEQLYFIIILCSIGFTTISYILFIALLVKKKHKKTNKKYDFDYEKVEK